MSDRLIISMLDAASLLQRSHALAVDAGQRAIAERLVEAQRDVNAAIARAARRVVIEVGEEAVS